MTISSVGSNVSSPVYVSFEPSVPKNELPVGAQIHKSLDVKSEYFISDFLRLHGLQIARGNDVKQIIIYHADNNEWSIKPECKGQLLTKLMAALGAGEEKIHNRVFLEVIRNWYQGLNANNKVENHIVASDHLNAKGQSIARMILEVNHNLGRGSEPLRLLDVGGNDGELTSYVASHIVDYANTPVHPYVLEVETGVSWDHNCHAISTVQNDRNQPVKTIYYDGQDMASGRVSGLNEPNPLSDGVGFDMRHVSTFTSSFFKPGYSTTKPCTDCCSS